MYAGASKAYVSDIFIKEMTAIIKGINTLDPVEMELVIQEIMDAEEIVIITHDKGQDMRVNLIGYEDNLLAIRDLIEAQRYTFNTIFHSDYPPDC